VDGSSVERDHLRPHLGHRQPLVDGVSGQLRVRTVQVADQPLRLLPVRERVVPVALGELEGERPSSRPALAISSSQAT